MKAEHHGEAKLVCSPFFLHKKQLFVVPGRGKRMWRMLRQNKRHIRQPHSSYSLCLAGSTATEITFSSQGQERFLKEGLRDL